MAESGRHYHRVRLLCSAFAFVSLQMFLPISIAKGASAPKDGVKITPLIEFHLQDLGYQAGVDVHYHGNGVTRDVSTLYDDSKKRLAFINDRVLVIYLSHFPIAGKDRNPAESRSMEALFVNATSGSLISDRKWVTSKRQWVNERWDTQARILPVREGFLVHAGNLLTLYSTGQAEKAKMSLDKSFHWAATVSPLGRTIHLQRIDADNHAEGMWLDSDSLKKMTTQQEMAGITSASDDAVVTKLARCIQFQHFGESPRSLCCLDPCRLGFPEFLSNEEILAVYPNGFKILSDNGKELWGRESANIKTRVVAGQQRSLDGNRFAIALSSDRNYVFDQVNIAKGETTILLYDRSDRILISALPIGSASQSDFSFCLSPDGRVLAVLVSDTIRLYKIP